jgi:hypothetical protein
MNWAARKREQREMNGGPRTRGEWTTDRTRDGDAAIPRGFGERTERAHLEEEPEHLQNICLGRFLKIRRILWL